MAERTLADNVAQVKADFKAVKDAIYSQVGYDLDNVPTNEYGNKVNDACAEMYGIGKEEGIMEGYENGKSDGINDGYTSGKADGIYEGIEQVISNSRYIEKSASGKVIRLDDVSEVYHNVKVKADTPTEVTVCGKNLFDGLLESGAIDSTTGSNLTTTGKRSVNYIPIVPNTTYTITREFTTGNIRTRFYDADKNYIGYGFSASTSPMTFTTKDNDYYLRLDLVGDTNNLTEKVQVEFGSASKYEPYTEQTITATPEGTEVPSMCPTMTFLADSDVTVDYFGSYGMQTEYDRFWDGFQNYGNRGSTGYDYSGEGWNNATFKPKYDIELVNYLFYNSRITDLVTILTERGVRLFRKNTNGNLQYAYALGRFTHLPLTDLSDVTNTTSTFANSSLAITLQSIEKIVSNEVTVFANNCFNNCGELIHCIFEGTIASNINLQWSKLLDLESLISLFRSLYLFYGTDEAYTKTITLSEESWALTSTSEFTNEFEGMDGKTFSYFQGWETA